MWKTHESTHGLRCKYPTLHSWGIALLAPGAATLLHSGPTRLRNRLRNKTKTSRTSQVARKKEHHETSKKTRYKMVQIQINGLYFTIITSAYHTQTYKYTQIRLNSKLKQKLSANLDVSQHPLWFRQIWPSLAVHHHAYQWKLAEPKTGDLRHGMTWLDTTGCLSMAAGPLRLARVLGLNARVGREH